MNQQLEVRVGWKSDTGKRPDNQDYVGVCLGSATQRFRHGVVAAIADGVGGHLGGRVAAETTVRSFIDAYLGQSETLGIRRAVARAAEAVNSWLYSQGRTDTTRAGMATTLTAIVLRHRHLHILHVGDSRLYRLRGQRLVQLTRDHVSDHPDERHVLRRAVGLEDALRADFAAEPLMEGDRLVLVTDGVHGRLREAAMQRILVTEAAPDHAAAHLVEAALEAGGQDNATALVADVLALPPAARDDLSAMAAALPIRAMPEPGETVDAYLVGALLSDGRYSRLFHGTDTADGGDVVLKFPKPAVADDELYRSAFVREGWVAARVRSPWLGEATEPAPGRQTCLYTVMPRYLGETLEQRIVKGPPMRLSDGLVIGAGLAKGLAALHRAGIIHRDVKPENVIVAPDGSARLIDFGVVRLPGIDELAPTAPGTPSYMPPEVMGGGQSDERSDIFALGVTLYRMYTGAYPYGEIEAFQRPRWGAPVPLQQRRPDLPGWLDLLLSRAVAVLPADRPADAIDLALELETGAGRPAAPLRRRPLLARNPVRFWQVLCLVLLVLLLVSGLLHR